MKIRWVRHHSMSANRDIWLWHPWSDEHDSTWWYEKFLEWCRKYDGLGGS